MTGLDRHHRPEDPRDGESAGMTGAADDEWGEWSDEDLLGMPDEALGRLGASLEPIEPPASMRADLLERIGREPQVTGGAVGSGGSAEAAGAGIPAWPVELERGASAEPAGPAEPVGSGGPEAAGPVESVGPVEPAAVAAGGESVEAGESVGAAPQEAEGRDAQDEKAAAERSGAVVPLHPRRRRWRTAGLRIAAAVVILGVGIGVGRWTALSSMAPTEHYAHLNQAQDVQRVTDTMPDGHIATLTWSEDMSMTALSLPSEMMDAAAGGGLQVWLRKGDAVSSLGLYDPASGTGFTFLDLMPEPGEQVFITQEPAGGSEQPTGEVLVAFDVNADGTTTRHSPSAPETGGADA